MKKRVVTALTLLVIAAVLVTAFTACEKDALLDSTWELAVIYNEYGEIVACGEGYAYDDDVKRVSVTCTLSKNAEIDIVYDDGEKHLTGEMTQISTGADGKLRYHVDYSDGTSGVVVYMAIYDKNTSYDATKTENDVTRNYALEVTITSFTEEYTLYFERVSSIK